MKIAAAKSPISTVHFVSESLPLAIKITVGQHPFARQSKHGLATMNVIVHLIPKMTAQPAMTITATPSGGVTGGTRIELQRATAVPARLLKFALASKIRKAEPMAPARDGASAGACR